MLPSESTPTPQPVEGLASSSAEPSSPVEAGSSLGTPGLLKTSQVWSAALCAGLLAGLLTLVIGETTYPLFDAGDATTVLKAYGPQLKKLGPYEQSNFITQRMRESQVVVETWRTAVEFGVLGALLGLGLGLAGERARGARLFTTRAGLIGLTLAGGLGVVMAFVTVPFYYKFISPSTGLEVPLMTHGGILAPLGAACGLAFGLGLARRGAILGGVVGSVLGAIIATFVFDLANALAFPMDQDPAPIPGQRVARILITLSVALLIAAFAAGGVANRPTRD